MSKSKVIKTCINCNKGIEDKEGCIFLKECTFGYVGIGSILLREGLRNRTESPYRSVSMSNRRGCVICNDCIQSPLIIASLLEKIKHQQGGK